MKDWVILSQLVKILAQVEKPALNIRTKFEKNYARNKSFETHGGIEKNHV